MKDDWVLEISESLSSIKLHGILVMVNTKGDKLFVKPISHKNGFIELFPLTIKELKELGMEI